MKKLILLAGALFLSGNAKGQLVVNDPGVLANVAIQIAEVKKSTEILTESGKSLQIVKDALKKGEQYLGTISAMVEKANYIGKFKELNNRAKQAQARTNSLVYKVYGDLSEGKLRSFLSSSQSLLHSINSGFSLIQDILKPLEKGGPKMNDFERMTFLDRKLEEMEQKTVLIEYQESYLLETASLEKLLNRIK